MSAAKHTPGPWAVEGESGNPGEAEVIIGNDRTICWTADTLKSPYGEAGDDESYISDEDRANARLIAAAPDLAAFVREVAEAGIFAWSENAYAALQKAGLL